MKAEHRDQWLNALRSGEYKQIKGVLYGSAQHGYCCLGLLAHVVGGVDNDKLESAGTCGFLAYETGGEYGLGRDCHEGDGLYRARDPESLTTLQRKLAAMNDNGHSFAEIADWIEANVPAE
jgi:hypothetical protein